MLQQPNRSFRNTHRENQHRYKEAIKFVTFKKGDPIIDEFEAKECVVCMEPFVEGERLRKLSTCRHMFHDKCLMQWLAGDQQIQSQKCPQCNEPITVESILTANSHMPAEQSVNKV